MSERPQWTKLGRDISVEDYLNGTAEEHNGHDYSDWKKELDREVEYDGRINKSGLARFMNVSNGATIDYWIAADRMVEG